MSFMICVRVLPLQIPSWLISLPSEKPIPTGSSYSVAPSRGVVKADLEIATAIILVCL